MTQRQRKRVYVRAILLGAGLVLIWHYIAGVLALTWHFLRGAGGGYPMIGAILIVLALGSVAACLLYSLRDQDVDGPGVRFRPPSRHR